jgi:heterodisulfide reductase subunit A-like polyferredoxin
VAIPDFLEKGPMPTWAMASFRMWSPTHQFETIAKAGKIARPSDGKEAKSVVFIQSPDKDENDADFAYAGAVTSMVSLKQAKYVREDYDADGKAYYVLSAHAHPGFSANTFTRACSRTRAFS